MSKYTVTFRNVPTQVSPLIFFVCMLLILAAIAVIVYSVVVTLGYVAILALVLFGEVTINRREYAIIGHEPTRRIAGKLICWACVVNVVLHYLFGTPLISFL